MADQNPTVDPRVVPVDLPVAQAAILRDDLLGWLAGIEEDLETPARLRDPAATGRVAGAVRRMLSALDKGEIELPDEEARAVLTKAAQGHDRAVEYARTVAVHDAHHALLAVLDGRAEGQP